MEDKANACPRSDRATQLPTEIWQYIFSVTSPKDVSAGLSSVCRHFNDLSLDEALWKGFCEPFAGVVNKIDEHSWRTTFINVVKNRPYISWAVLGEGKTGKSSLCRRLLFDNGLMSKEEYWRLETETRESSKISWHKCSWTLEEPPKKIDVTTKKERIWDCMTPTHHMVLIDTPGKRKYRKTTYTASAMADYGLVVISAREGEFETGISKSGQTREHMMLAFTMGIKRLVIAMNKFDRYKHDLLKRFEEIQREVLGYCRRLGFNPDAITFVPISSVNGDNVKHKLDSIEGASQPIAKWFNGPSLWEALTSQPHPPRKPHDLFRMAVHRIYQPNEGSLILMGKIHFGTLKVGDTVTPAPQLRGVSTSTRHWTTEVISIERNHVPRNRASSGEIVGVRLRLGKKELKPMKSKCYRASNTLSTSVGPFTPSSALKFERVTCQLIILNSPNGFKAGMCGTMLCNTSAIPVRVVKLLRAFGRRDMDQIDPKVLKAGSTGLVLLEPLVDVKRQKKQKAMSLREQEGYCVDAYSQCPAWGRFFFYADGQSSMACGVIKDLNPFG